KLPGILGPPTHWQAEHGWTSSKDTCQCRIPGRQRSNDTEPATERASSKSEFSKGQKQEGDSEKAEDDDQGPVAPERAKEHQGGEDCPTQEEETERCLGRYQVILDAVTEGKPETTIGGEGGGTEGIARPKFPHASEDLDDASIEKG